ncbi:MAG TPA: 1-phosphofructokinase family hexose kinase [Chitinophagaceae bacterium]|nr:1-phosphofructokinase family hexose kinase [Chitinophagaceae bacterium]
MPNIVTLTFSPSIDKSTSVPALIPGKKLKCSTPKLEPGGGGINVARAIKKLRGEALAVYPAGGQTGKHFNALLEAEAVPVVIIKTKKETRENIIVLDESTNQQYRFGMPGTELSESECQQCFNVIEEMKNVEFIVASGSLPPGAPLDVYARLAVMAKKKKAKLVVDTSGEALKHAANEGVYLLKPNLGELSSLLGIGRINVQEIEKIAKLVIDKGHCEVLVISMGEAGAIIATKNEMYRAVPPVAKRRSVVGAGDSMVAGIVLALSKNKNLKEALQYGVACGTAATMNPGTELCKLQDVEDLYQKIVVGEK